MREVLAKNPQVEQQTVFLEDTNPGNQARKVNVVDLLTMKCKQS
jgi:hypothetical protein